jgi:hypothetical protein
MEFFKSIDKPFHLYYDTELFGKDWYERVFAHIEDSSENWKNFKKALETVLGIKSREFGIRNYRFEQIDVDIFGGTYERFLAEQRKERKIHGIYYTPAYITSYIITKTVDPILGNLFEEIKNEMSYSTIDFNKLIQLKEKLFDLAICDIACGSGSFLTEALEHIWDYFLDLDLFINNLKKKEIENYKMLKRAGSMQMFVTTPFDECLELFMLNDIRRLLATTILRCIYGVDLDERAISIAKLNIWLKIIVLAPEEFKVENIPSDAQHILPNLELNFFVGDSLSSLPDDEIISHILIRQHEIMALSNGREVYIDNYQSEDPSILREIIENVKKELDDKFSNFLNNNNLGFIPSCYFPLFFWHRYFKKSTVYKRDLKDIGFNIIIGNPPYGNIQLERTLAIMRDAYSSYIDIYTALIERAIGLLKESGKLGYIVPVTWETGPMYESFRKIILLKNKIDFVVNLPFNTFNDAYVDTCILILTHGEIVIPISDDCMVFEYKKRERIDNKIEPLIKYDRINYSYIVNEPSNRIYMHPSLYQIQDLLSTYPILDNVVASTRGIEAYQYTFSNTIQSQPACHWEKFYEFGNTTNNVYRYELILGNSKYVDLSKDLNRKSSDGYYYLDYFKGDRLLLRRIVSRQNMLMAAFTSEDFVVKKDLYCIKQRDNNYAIKYVLALINSRFFAYIYLARSAAATKDDFRQVTLNDLRSLPVFPASDNEQKDIMKLVETIIILKEKVRQENLSDKIEDYYVTDPVSTESLESFINWNNKEVPSQKKIFVNKQIYGELDSIRTEQKNKWLTLYCSGKEFRVTYKLTTGEKVQKHPFVDMPLFGVKEEDDRISEFFSYYITNGSRISYSRSKTLLQSVINIKIPRFATSAKQNILFITKTIDAYRKGISKYLDLTKQIFNLDSEIDARIFKLYRISKYDAERIMLWLDQDSEFINSVLDKM